MGVRERGAAGILAAQPNEGPLGTERTEGERLGGRPVDALAALDRLPLRLELAGDLSIDVEPLRHMAEGGPDRLQEFGRGSGLPAPIFPRRDLEPRPRTL